jgi:tRNA dimethylallyltransferase
MSGAIYIAGPTASGKSAVAMLLAERLGGEIISVDSMQVYRGMDTGTAKPTPLERAHVPHHLIDVAAPNETFDTARFLTLARTAEKDIITRHRLPIFCGGTGLYFNALLSGIGRAPGANQQLRAELERTELPVLLDELAEEDPETFARIDRANPRRVIRAVEVIRATGKPFSEQRARWMAEDKEGHWIGFRRGRDDLNRRINARVDSMFASGLVDETRELLRQGLAENRTAMQAIGYRQVVEHLNGERDLKTTIDLVKQKTRQYAKRQMTWFRNQLRLQWVDIEPETTPQEIAVEILLRIEAGQPPATI